MELSKAIKCLIFSKLLHNISWRDRQRNENHFYFQLSFVFIFIVRKLNYIYICYGEVLLFSRFLFRLLFFLLFFWFCCCRRCCCVSVLEKLQEQPEILSQKNSMVQIPTSAKSSDHVLRCHNNRDLSVKIFGERDRENSIAK